MSKLILYTSNTTPILMSGADAVTPEARSPSMRGLLRFWLRALLGRTFGDDLIALRVQESYVFGSTGWASPVVVEFSPDQASQCERRVLPHRANSFHQRAWAEHSRFSVTVSSSPANAELPIPALAALLLLANLGGVGKRSRRGFGSLTIRKVKCTQDLSEHPLTKTLHEHSRDRPRDGHDLADRVQCVLKRVGQVFGATTASAPVAGLPTYPILSSQHAKVVVCEDAMGRDYEQAMIQFWHLLRSAPYCAHERAFGHAIGGRRASPLFLHMAETDSGICFVLTAFRSEPAPLGDQGWNTLDSFLNDCMTHWSGRYLLGEDQEW